jgi:hypothetical protein
MKFKTWISEQNLIEDIIDRFSNIDGFLFTKNPNFKKIRGELFKHTTRKENMKSIFDNGLIPQKTKGWYSSAEIWAWTSKLKDIIGKFQTKKEILILFKMPKDKVTKFPSEPVATMDSVPKENIIGALIKK